jgi:hypothetical protein
MGDKSFASEKFFSFVPITFGIFGGQIYYFSIKAIVAKQNYICSFICYYILCNYKLHVHVQGNAPHNKLILICDNALYAAYVAPPFKKFRL